MLAPRQQQEPLVSQPWQVGRSFFQPSPPQPTDMLMPGHGYWHADSGLHWDCGLVS